MSYRDALRDGVRVVRGQKMSYYMPRCPVCGTEVFTYAYVPEHWYLCERCKPLKRIWIELGMLQTDRKGGAEKDIE